MSDEFDDDNFNIEDDDYDPGEECGRWINGKFGRHCSMAGTEFCICERFAVCSCAVKTREGTSSASSAFFCAW